MYKLNFERKGKGFAFSGRRVGVKKLHLYFMHDTTDIDFKKV